MRWIGILLATLVVGGAIVAGGYFWLLGPTEPGSRPQMVVVKPGSGLGQIAQTLQARGLIRSSAAFLLHLRLSGQDRAVKAGVYAVKPGLDATRVAALLIEGRSQSKHLTIPEGYSLQQIAGRLNEFNPQAAQQFIEAAQRPERFSEEFAFLKELPPTRNLEGYLFPDTYVLHDDPDIGVTLIRMMLTRFEAVSLDAYATLAARSPLPLHQALTLASIVEKEAVHAAERPLIAGVFYNRLRIGMPLGSDPTVEYALKRHQGAKGLSLRDVQIDSPYNTYRKVGLPPGPIANPGLDSLTAVLKPQPTDLLYFVARGDGTHWFTHNYRDHLNAQRQIIASQQHKL